MSFLSKVKSFFVGVKQKAVAGWSSLRLGGYIGIDRKTLLDNNKNWVYVCVDKISDTVAAAHWRLMKYGKDGKDEELFDHPALRALENPNEYMTQRELMYMTIAHQELTGNAYWHKDSPKNPKVLFPISPDVLKEKVDVKDGIALLLGYQVTTSSKMYSKEDIVHFKYPSVRSPFCGSGTLENIAAWVDIDNLLTDFDRNVFKNGAKLSGILETDATTEERLKMIRASWEDNYMGSGNAFKTAVLPKDWKYTADGLSPSEVESTEKETSSRDKILSAFGVPKSVVGITEIGVSRADAEAKNYVFLAFTIKPKLERLKDYLNEKFLPSFSNSDNLYFVYNDPVPENQDYNLRYSQTSLGMGQSWQTINEIRSRYGLAPISNGDSVMGGFTTIPIGQPIPEPTKAQKPKVRRSPEEKKEEGITKALKILEDKLGSAEEVHKAFISRVSKFEGAYIKGTLEHDQKLKEEALKKLQEEGKSIKALPELIDEREAIRTFIGFSMPILQELIRTEGKAQIDRLDTSNPYNPLDQNIQGRLEKVLKLTSQSYTDTTLKLLRSQLSEGVSAGESIRDLARRVSDVFELSSRYRAEQVARTTVFSVANQTVRDAYRQSGVVKTVVWHTAEDELVCPFCEPLDGKVVDVEEEFFEVGDIIRGSNGNVIEVNEFSAGDPPIHPGCRCFTNVGKVSVERSEDDPDIKSLQEILEVLENE